MLPEPPSPPRVDASVERDDLVREVGVAEYRDGEVGDLVWSAKSSDRHKLAQLLGIARE